MKYVIEILKYIEVDAESEDRARIIAHEIAHYGGEKILHCDIHIPPIHAFIVSAGDSNE